MARGTIVRVKKGYTGIIRGEDGQEYRFNRNRIIQGEKEQIVRGRVVEFKPDGDWATQIQLLDEVAEMEKPEPVSIPKSVTPPTPKGGYRFLNPYNFVRSLTVQDPSKSLQLGRAAPPPHDRYIGISGRITCRITAVTPLFVSDSHGVTPDSEVSDHYHYRFFRDPEGNIAIPATSVRGMIRSLFEAATNSCFIHLSGDKEPGDKRLSYHLPPGDALRLVPARVRKQGKEWLLELLPGTTSVNPDRRPSGPQYAAWVMTYRPILKSRTKVKVPNSPYSRRRSLNLQGYEHGKKYWAIIEEVKHPLRHFDFWNVVAIANSEDSLPRPRDGQLKVQGYLCINYQNIENKHDERFFFRVPENTSYSQPLPLPGEVRKQYAELIADYQERHSKEVEKRKRKKVPLSKPAGRKPAFSRFIVDKEAKHIKDGDLVYAMLERQGMSVKVRFLVPVSVPRVGYEQTIGSLLFPPDLKFCDSINNLCPACRVFGWVHPNPLQDDNRVPVAYAGRVQFSHATRKENESPDGEFDATLSILSTPKPTTSRFYLRPQQGKPRDGLSDDKVNYDAPGQVLRGRKFYRHHGEQLNETEYTAADDKSDQNRTLHQVQSPGTEFEFAVHFENLAPVELGALLWSLEIEGWHHRMGYAKPLGFGSVKIDIVTLETIDWERRLSSLEDNAGWNDDLHKKDKWIQEFKEAMAERYGLPFADLDNIRDLQALLAETPPLPVHYPRPSKKPLPDGRNYEWFVGNKRSGRNAGPRLTLPLAEDDSTGLPLIDRFGNIVSD